MNRSRYTEERIAFALKPAELDTPAPEVRRKMGVLSIPIGGKGFVGIIDEDP